MAYFVYLNGPPKSGKDTLANLLEAKYWNVTHLKFAQMLRDAVTDIFGIGEAEFEGMKDLPTAIQFCEHWDTISGAQSTDSRMSYRELVIRLSEKVLKPNFGKGYLGIALAESVEANAIHVNHDHVYIISDLGFVDELHEFQSRATITDDLIIQLHRKGCDFSNDSRDYLPSSVPCCITNLHNDNTVESLGNTTARIINEMLAETASRLIEK